MGGMKASELDVLPVDLEMRGEARYDNEVEGPVTRDLIGDVDVPGWARSSTCLPGSDAGKRRRPDSNWCTRLCRPLPNHSATSPDRGILAAASERAGTDS